MELFSMLAKLTLDAKDFKRQLDAAQKEADNLKLEDPKLGLNDEDFRSGIADANSATVDDLDSPELDLDDADFTSKVDDANAATVDDPDDPELDLDDSSFDTKIDDANEAEVDDPDSPTLDLDSEPFTSGLKDAENEGNLFFEVMKGVFSGLKDTLVATGVVGMVAGLVNYLKQGVALAGESGDKIDKASQKMGISAKAYQEWNYALGLSGASIDDLNRGLKTWQAAVGDGDAEEKLAASFNQLGIDAKKAFEQLQKGEGLDGLLEKTIYALADYEGGDRGALVTALFGKNATMLNALLNSTSEDIKGMRQEAEDLGLVMTDEEVKNAAAYMDATSRLHQAVEGLHTSLSTWLLPALTDAANELAKIVAIFNWRGDDNSLAAQLKEIDENGAGALASMAQDQAQAEALIDKIANLGDYFTLDDKGKKTYDVLLQELINLYPQLDSALSNNKNAIFENTEQIKANIEEWTKLAQQRILDETIAEKREAVANQYAAAMDKEIQADVKETEASGKKLAAYEAIDRFLASRKGEGYRMNLESWDGYTGTMTDEIYAKNAGAIYNWMREAANSSELNPFQAWVDTKGEVEALREEATNMYTEADAAMEDLTKYQEALAEKLGLTQTEAQNATSEVQLLQYALDHLPSEVNINVTTSGFPRAIGDAYVPYDNFPALLHRGEKVLTATEARRGAGNIDLSGMEDRIVDAIRRGMSNASVNSYLNGQDITDDVNRNTMRQLKARRFSG